MRNASCRYEVPAVVTSTSTNPPLLQLQLHNCQCVSTFKCYPALQCRLICQTYSVSFPACSSNINHFDPTFLSCVTHRVIQGQAAILTTFKNCSAGLNTCKEWPVTDMASIPESSYLLRWSWSYCNSVYEQHCALHTVTQRMNSTVHCTQSLSLKAANGQ